MQETREDPMAVHTGMKQVTLPAFTQLTPPKRHYPTPSPSPYPGPFSLGRSSALHSSLDTPLASYTAQRHLYRLHTSSRGASTVQVPLSALSSPRANLGAVGGSFKSTTKIKSIPLPTIYDSHQVTQRGVRNIRLHAQRYTPSTGHSRTVSDSLLHLPKISNRQNEHMRNRETHLQSSRALQRASTVVPHRVEKAFYMSGHTAQVFNRQEISPEELQQLQTLSLSQNPELFYGRGMRSRGKGVRSTAVDRFEWRLRQASERRRRYSWEGMPPIDTGRYSRASRGITPAPTIPEEKGEEKTFVTQRERTE